MQFTNATARGTTRDDSRAPSARQAVSEPIPLLSAENAVPSFMLPNNMSSMGTMPGVAGSEVGGVGTLFDLLNQAMAASPPADGMASDADVSLMSGFGRGGAQMLLGAGGTQAHSMTEGMMPSVLSPLFSVDSSLPSSVVGSVEQQGLHMGYGSLANGTGFGSGGAVHLAPATPQMSTNVHAGTGGAHTAPATPMEASTRMSPEQRRALRERKAEIANSVQPVRAVSVDLVQFWINEQEIGQVKKNIEKGVKEMACRKKEVLRNMLKGLDGVTSSSRESSVSRKKDECILYGYMDVVDVLLEIIYKE